VGRTGDWIIRGDGDFHGGEKGIGFGSDLAWAWVFGLKLI